MGQDDFYASPNEVPGTIPPTDDIAKIKQILATSQDGNSVALVLAILQVAKGIEGLNARLDDVKNQLNHIEKVSIGVLEANKCIALATESAVRTEKNRDDDRR